MMPAGLSDWVDDLQQLAERTGQRPLVWLAGDGAHAQRALVSILQDSSCMRRRDSGNMSGAVWVSRAFGDHRRLPSELRAALEQNAVYCPVHRSHLLGTQSRLLIYDAHQGFDPDLFCLATGTLQSGGLLLLLAPEPQHWQRNPDPDYQRMLVYPYTLDDVACRFMQRVVGLWTANQGTSPNIVAIWQLHHRRPLAQLAADLPSSFGSVSLPSESGHRFHYTHDQQRIISSVTQRVHECLHKSSCPPLVITADRGRGKSAAIGAALASLKSLKVPVSVWVTAPHRDNVNVLFQHCARNLPRAQGSFEQRCLADGELRVRFMAPDEVHSRLVQGAADRAEADAACDLLVVEEAAGIPESLLKNFVNHAPLTLFSTTVHGYEGTGRGFQIRFQPYLDQQFPQWQLLTLQHPIRWGDRDRLEALLNSTFFLGAEANPVPVRPDKKDMVVAELSQDQLLANEHWLEQLFSLLMLAHYRTSPGDLRDLLDGLNLRLFVLRQGTVLLGCCLVAMEGDLPADLVEQIYQARRRPRGHLLPQTVCQCLGNRELALTTTARVVRIAVQPEWQGQGLGSRLLDAVEKVLVGEGLQSLGSSFAAYADVIRFWQGNGYLPLRLGFTREKTSGAHSLLILKALQPDSEFLVKHLATAFSRAFPYLRQNEFRELPLDISDAVQAWLNNLELIPQPDLDQHVNRQSEDQVKSFIEGFRTFEDSRYALWCLLCLYGFGDRGHGHHQPQGRRPPDTALDDSATALLQALFSEQRRVTDLQKPPWNMSKKSVVARLRQIFSGLTDSPESPGTPLPETDK